MQLGKASTCDFFTSHYHAATYILYCVYLLLMTYFCCFTHELDESFRILFRTYEVNTHAHRNFCAGIGHNKMSIGINATSYYELTLEEIAELF